MIHKIKVFSVVNEEETDVLLEFSWFFCDATDVGSWVSGSFALSKHSLYIWKFLVYILLKPSLKDFMHNFVMPPSNIFQVAIISTAGFHCIYAKI